jgi:hypothetical protein
MAAIAGHRLTLDPMGKCGSNRPSGFGEEAWKSLQTTDNGRRTPSDGNSSHGPLVFCPGELIKLLKLTIYM